MSVDAWFCGTTGRRRRAFVEHESLFKENMEKILFAALGFVLCLCGTYTFLDSNLPGGKLSPLC